MKPAKLPAYTLFHTISGLYNRKTFCLKAILSMLGFVLISVQINAQAVSQKPDLKFQRIHEGLTGNRVTAIHQDNRGFIWVGTTRGLHRYNGIQFDIYSYSSDSTSISHNYINVIYEDELQPLVDWYRQWFIKI
jgi:ligand-binding sensor domain-containing protein